MTAANLKSKSVLVVCDSYPPVLGGSEIEAQRVCAGLRKGGHDARVICSGPPVMPAVTHWTDPYGTPVQIVGRGLPDRLRMYAFAMEVARVIRRDAKRLDVVYFLMQGLHLATGMLAARSAGVPFVMKFSGSSIISGLTQSALGRWELQKLQQWAHRVMVLNEGMMQEAIAAGFRREQLLWMPNPVDTDEYAPMSAEQRSRLRSERKIPPDAAVILFVGRLAPEKELPSLIRGFAQLRRERKAVLVFIGDGPEKERLIQLAREEQLNDQEIVFTGRLNTTEVCHWLQASDLFALVSSNEGFSCSLLEAMSVGLPSVVSDIPANRQLIEDGQTGFLTKVGDSGEIAESLRKLVDSDLTRSGMGTKARLLVQQNYSTEKILERYEQLFEEAILSAHPTSSR